MVDFGESSSSKSSEDLWAKLVARKHAAPCLPRFHIHTHVPTYNDQVESLPVGSNFPDVEIRSNEMVVNSEMSSSSLDKHEWCKISRSSNKGSAKIQNLSSSTIIVDGEAVENQDFAAIDCGSEIISGPARENHLSYRFQTISALELRENRLRISVDVENTKCGICLSIWHDVITAAPCLHNFCNGCFSEWLKRSQDRNASVICPQCRAVVQFIGKNHFLRNIVEDILRADPSLRRSDEEVAHLDGKATIGSNLIIRSGRRRKRSRSMQQDEENEISEHPCPQWGTEYHGFRCNPNTVHMQCQTCGGMMPSRPNSAVPQHCLGCDRAFCGAYWHSQGLTGREGYPICPADSFKPIIERSVSRMPYVAHEKNRHEQDITERCIIQMGRTLQDVISEWVGRFNNRAIDRTRLQLNHAENLTAQTYLCNGCYEKFVSFVLYWFRVTMPKRFLPADVGSREDCWYGYSCRTQHHSEQHARKRNHVCCPTRGSQFTLPTRH